MKTLLTSIFLTVTSFLTITNAQNGQCLDFNDRDLSNWKTINDAIIKPGNGGGSLDGSPFMVMADGGNHVTSWVFNDVDFTGDLTDGGEGCLLCYDFRLSTGGPPDNPFFNIYRGSDPQDPNRMLAKFTFTTPSGSWTNLCIPLTLSTNNELPSNAFGEWSMLTGGPNEFDELITNVTGIAFSTDYNSNPGEVLSVDNICKTCCSDTVIIDPVPCCTPSISMDLQDCKFNSPFGKGKIFMDFPYFNDCRSAISEVCWYLNGATFDGGPLDGLSQGCITRDQRLTWTYQFNSPACIGDMIYVEATIQFDNECPPVTISNSIAGNCECSDFAKSNQITKNPSELSKELIDPSDSEIEAFESSYGPCSCESRLEEGCCPDDWLQIQLGGHYTEENNEFCSEEDVWVTTKGSYKNALEHRFGYWVFDSSGAPLFGSREDWQDGSPVDGFVGFDFRDKFFDSDYEFVPGYTYRVFLEIMHPQCGFMSVSEDFTVFESACMPGNAPLNPRVENGNLVWDPIPCALGYEISSLFSSDDCNCRSPKSFPTIKPKRDNTFWPVPDDLKGHCFTWQVRAICIDYTRSDYSEPACFGGEKIIPGSSQADLSIIPNPTNGTFNVEINHVVNQEVVISIIRFDGLHISRFTERAGKNGLIKVNLKMQEELTEGLYTIIAQSDDYNVVKTFLVVK